MTATITNHGKQRTKDRTGLSKKAAGKLAEKALLHGVHHNETKGRFRRYMDGLYLRHGSGNNNRVYNRKIFIFQGEVLITVLNLPHNFSAMADKLQKMKKEKTEKETVES
jgi:hypothetical protein